MEQITVVYQMKTPQSYLEVMCLQYVIRFETEFCIIVLPAYAGY